MIVGCWMGPLRNPGTRDEFLDAQRDAAKWFKQQKGACVRCASCTETEFRVLLVVSNEVDFVTIMETLNHAPEWDSWRKTMHQLADFEKAYTQVLSGKLGAAATEAAKRWNPRYPENTTSHVVNRTHLEASNDSWFVQVYQSNFINPGSGAKFDEARLPWVNFVRDNLPNTLHDSTSWNEANGWALVIHKDEESSIKELATFAEPQNEALRGFLGFSDLSSLTCSVYTKSASPAHKEAEKVFNPTYFFGDSNSFFGPSEPTISS